VNWSRAHWRVGLLTLLVFPVTGAYMRHVAGVPHLDSVPRLIFRSRHLFLLVAAVANLALSHTHPVRLAQRMASVLILASPFLLFAAFFIDPARGLRAVRYSTSPCTACSQREYSWRSPTGLEAMDRRRHEARTADRAFSELSSGAMLNCPPQLPARTESANQSCSRCSRRCLGDSR
jgi:hypothetical protein